MYHSQIGQDAFIDTAFKKYFQDRTEGTFLDIGCQHYSEINNTYFFERELNWRGIGIDIEEQYEQGWKDNRKNSLYVRGDATTIDYGKLLTDNNMPKTIDYLSLDLEPPPLTLKALERLFESGYIFNFVTYETDYYREASFGHGTLRQPSQDIFKAAGYKLISEGVQDDYYIHSSLLS